jgi:hypothetical protein
MRAPLAMNKKASIAVALVLVGVFAATFSLLAATTTTATFAQNAITTTSSNNATTTTMANKTEGGAATLGKQILQETGHAVVNRVIAVNNTSATIESTYTDKGTFNGTTSVTDMGTVTYTINNMGQVAGKGQGLLRTSDGAMAAYKERYTGSEDIHGKTNIQGTMNFTSLATGSLGSLHGADLVFKVQTDTSGNSELKGWEIKH